MQTERSIELSESPVLKGFDGRGNIKSVVLGAASLPAVNEIQVVTLRNAPSGGNFTLTYDGQETGNIAYNASASAVDTALEALSNVASGEVTVTGSAGGPYNIQFTGGKAGTVQNLIEADASGLTTNGLDNPEVDVERTQNGRPAASEDVNGRFTFKAGTILTVDPDNTETVKPYEAAEDEVVVGILGTDVELYGTTSPRDDRGAPCLYHNCVFDSSKIIGFVTHEDDLVAALNTCRFE
jgi:hypothetical protein